MKSALVNNVINLNKRTAIEKPSRTEPTTQVSEFNLVKSGTRKGIALTELTKTLKTGSKHARIKEKIQVFKNKIKRLPKPLEKPKADRIRRSIAFDEVKEQLDRYNAVVTSNRASNYLTFPSAKDIEIETGKDFSGYRIKSDLQKRLDALTPKPKVEVIHLDKKQPYSLTMEEMLTRRKEMAKMKVIEGYKVAKARRQNKIKSKKFHRIQRREKVKNQIKDFEQLQKTNPEEALKKLDEIDRVRAEERASLRHRSTGKWARSKQVKAKYDNTNRQELAEQLALSHELTQKIKAHDETESEDESVSETPVHKDDKNNPWVNSIKTTDEVESFVSGYRKFWDEKNAKKADEKVTEEPSLLTSHSVKNVSSSKQTRKRQNVVRCVATSQWSVSVISDTDEEDEEPQPKKSKQSVKAMVPQKPVKTTETGVKKSKKEKKKQQTDFEKLSFHKEATRPVIDEPLDETSGTNDNAENLNKILATILSSRAKPAVDNSKSHNIDPNDIINTKGVHLQSELPDLVIDEDGNDQEGVIAEAFEDDDVVADFQKEKRDEIEGDKPEDINLFLPGWGSWGGPGIKSSPKKRANKRFILKFPEVAKRRDENKGNLIISEKADDKIKSHLVSEIPFPFKTVKDFEASIRAPIGNTFIPETAFRKMIRPAVRTKMGAIIEPMSEEILLKVKK